jgi:hypothetical protein
MILLSTLLIPFLATIILFFFFKKKVLWWEFTLLFVGSLAVAGISKLCMLNVTSDTEYWGGVITKVEYYEPWDEWVDQTCEYACGEDCDSKGENCTTVYCEYDCSYRDYHSEYWRVVNNLGESWSVNELEYNRLVKKFNTGKQFVDMHRDYDLNDGDMYETKWGGEDVTLEATVTTHSYENRVQVSKDVFNFPEVDTTDIKMYGLYDYPSIHSYYKQSNILGPIKNKKVHEHTMEILNGRLGHSKQLKTFVLVFKNKTRDAGFKQEAYWKGGNKNEFVLCVGINDDNNIDWVYPFSWTESQICKVNIRTFVEEQEKFDIGKTIPYMYTELNKNFKRKEFADFEYLTIDPSDKHLFWTYFFSLLVTIGLSIFFIFNNYDDETPDGYKGYRGYYRNRYRY